MKKLLILALASAVAAASNAADWFSVAVSGSTQTTTGASWSTTPAAADVANNVISIDADEAITLSPTATKPSPEVKTVVEVQAAFTAASDYSSLEPLKDAKTALTVAKDGNTLKYYYWDSAESDPNVNKWKAITDLTPTLSETPVTVTFELDNSSTAATTAKITIGNKTVTVGLAADTTLGALAFAGTGTLKSVDATVTPAYATYNNTRYETMANAVTARDGGNGVITVHNPTGSYPGGIIQNSTTHELYFPRTTTADQDGSTVPYEIADADDLKALADAVNAGNTCSGKCFVQTADIDMTGTSAFAGVGTYAENPTGGTPFAGTYDGGNFKISNVTMTARNYGGIFNQVNGGTIKNLTVENISTAATSVEFGYAIVGNAGNGATLENLTAAGAFLSTEKPGTHNMAGIVVRACGGGVSGTLITSCTNNATIYGDYTKLGGICALTQYKVSGGGSVTFDGCVNNGTLVSARTAEENASKQITGIAGIVGYTADATVLKDCVNNGTITVALADQTVGELVGSGGVETHGSLTDAGGNKADATKKMVHTRGVVTGFQYATVAKDVATTVTSLTKDTTYLLEGNVAASETPVFTLAANGDKIMFDTALGYTFNGTVGSSVLGWSAKPTSDGTVKTYSLEQTATPVVSEAVTTLVAVPRDCKAAELIDLSNRAAGDVLKVYSKADSDKCYYTWTLSSGKEWTPATTYKVSEASATSHEKPASEVQLYAGQAAWLTRVNPNEAITLAVVAESDTINVTVDNGWNMIAPLPKGNESTVALNAVVSAGAAGDEIKIPTAGAPITCTYDSKTEKWGYWSFIKNDKGRITGKTWVSDVTIPAGTGLWYINGGSSKSVELK